MQKLQLWGLKVIVCDALLNHTDYCKSAFRYYVPVIVQFSPSSIWRQITSSRDTCKSSLVKREKWHLKFYYWKYVEINSREIVTKIKVNIYRLVYTTSRTFCIYFSNSRTFRLLIQRYAVGDADDSPESWN